MPRRNPHAPPPESLPPEKVRFAELRVEPWPDGHRIRVHVTLSPFLRNPNLQFAILDNQGQEISHASIIENTDDRFVFTMHLRTNDLNQSFTLIGSVFYEQEGIVDTRSVQFISRAEEEINSEQE